MSASIRTHFSRAARTYEEGAKVQHVAAKRLAKLLPQEPAWRVLDLGCGTGFFTRELLERYPSAEITAVDISSEMIAQAKTLVWDNVRVNWVCANGCSYRSKEGHGLITSSSSLQWMTPHASLFSHIREELLPQGQLVFSTMLQGTLEELHQLRAELYPDLVPKERLRTQEEVSCDLTQAGFSTSHVSEEKQEAVFSSGRDFFSSIRLLGFTGGALSQGKRALTRGELSRLLSEYEKRFSTPAGGVWASFNSGYFVAQKGS